jgi:hypothetical protein
MRTVATRRTLPLRIMVCRFGGHGAGTSPKARGGHHGAATVQYRVAAGAKGGGGTVGLAECGHETSLFCMRNIVAIHVVVSKHFAAKSPDARAALPSGSQNCRPGRATLYPMSAFGMSLSAMNGSIGRGAVGAQLR